MSSSHYQRKLSAISSYNAGIGDAMIARLDHGNQILLPKEVLAEVVNLDVYSGLMNWKLTSSHGTVYAGMLEAIASADTVVLPISLMTALCVNEGDSVDLEFVVLPRATDITLKAHRHEFYTLENPKAVLEHNLRNHAVLYRGQVITINYLNRVFGLEVISVRGSAEECEAVDIINTDIRLEFMPAEDAPVAPRPPPSYAPTTSSGYVFPGPGRLAGSKAVVSPSVAQALVPSAVERVQALMPSAVERVQAMMPPSLIDQLKDAARPTPNGGLPIPFSGPGRRLGSRREPVITETPEPPEPTSARSIIVPAGYTVPASSIGPTDHHPYFASVLSDAT